MQTTKFQNEAVIYHTKLNFHKYFYILLLQLFLCIWNVLEELKNLSVFFFWGYIHMKIVVPLFFRFPA